MYTEFSLFWNAHAHCTILPKKVRLYFLYWIDPGFVNVFFHAVFKLVQMWSMARGSTFCPLMILWRVSQGVWTFHVNTNWSLLVNYVHLCRWDLWYRGLNFGIYIQVLWHVSHTVHFLGLVSVQQNETEASSWWGSVFESFSCEKLYVDSKV